MLEFPFDRRSDLKAMLSLAAIFFAVFLVVFFYLYRNIQMANLRYELKKLARQERRLYLEVEELRLKVAKYSSAERMEKLFREKYGYLPVHLGQKIVTLELPQTQKESHE
ncbi:MAG: hypothetical protein NZM25_04965 [Leptospiraceae bacterium]|nr:hypothetical protein [Leptospiraceae bacterium]MDW8305639.1 hypothetical protein [Leptospiraceae bacterium]